MEEERREDMRREELGWEKKKRDVKRKEKIRETKKKEEERKGVPNISVKATSSKTLPSVSFLFSTLSWHLNISSDTILATYHVNLCHAMLYYIITHLYWWWYEKEMAET